MIESGPGPLDLLRVFGALILVTGVVVGCGLFVRRGFVRSSSRRLKVEERLMLSRGAQLVVVANGDEKLIVGVSADKGVNLISKLDEMHPSGDESNQTDRSGWDPLTDTQSETEQSNNGFYQRLTQQLAKQANSQQTVNRR